MKFLLGCLLIGIVCPFSVFADESSKTTEKVTEVVAEDVVVEENQSVADMFKTGKAYLNFRYRYEFVNQDGISKEANASTLRTRLGYDTGKLYGFSGKLEIEDVSDVGNDNFNDTVNGKTQYPVVADPNDTEVNQAYVTYEGIGETTLRGGREALNFDNQRFIGDVAWRQNNQTYDGVNLINKSLEDLTLFYGYVSNVNRIFGEDSDVGDLDTNLNLFNARYTGFENATLVAYSYLLDVDDTAGFSTTNFGGIATGKAPINEKLNALYDFEYAYQQDYENNPEDFGVNYWRAIAGIEQGGYSLEAGLESLGSDDGKVAFGTPFSTLHKWNGWADKFLTTPADGLNDALIRAKASLKNIHDCLDGATFETVYHYFSSEEDNLKYGEEWDVKLNFALPEAWMFGVKYASYNSANFATDTDKLILSLATQFSQ